MISQDYGDYRILTWIRQSKLVCRIYLLFAHPFSLIRRNVNKYSIYSSRDPGILLIILHRHHIIAIIML